MDEIPVLVRRAARRMAWQVATRLLSWTFIGLGAALCLAIVADRLVYLGRVPGTGLRVLSGGVLATALGLSLALTAVLVYRRWPRRGAVALEVDDRLGLAERISSALAVAQADDPMARAVVADARSYARMAPVNQAFPLRGRRELWGVLGVAVLAAGLARWMPQMDLLANRQRIEEERQDREALRREARELRRDLVTIRKSVELQRPERIDEYLEKTEEVLRAMEAGKLSRPEAMAKLNDLAEMLKEAQQSVRKDAALPPNLAQKTAGLDRVKELAKALARQDLAGAREQLQKLAGEQALKTLSKDDLRQLSRELSDLAKALDKSQAGSGSTTKPANQKNKGQEGSTDLAKDLAAALQDLSQGLQEGDADQISQAMGQCNMQFDKAAQLEAEMALLQQAQSMCQGGQNNLASSRPAGGRGTGQSQGQGGRVATGIYTQGDGRGRGPGMGGPGIGEGGLAPLAETPTAFVDSPVKGQQQPGRVVASWLVEGKQVKGEAKADYVQAVESAATDAAQAIQDEKIPLAYEAFIRDYFQAMKNK
jgi:hypothetical protein